MDRLLDMRLFWAERGCEPYLADSAFANYPVPGICALEVRPSEVLVEIRRAIWTVRNAGDE